MEESVKERIIAHRGCWDKDIPENSLKSFQIAKEKGLAIELDVHKLIDGSIAVFHDFFLSRMCYVPWLLFFLTEKWLKKLKLKGGNEHVPTLKEVLEIVDGQVPIYIEIKCKINHKYLCDLLLKELKNYKGKIVFISFNQKALKYISENSEYPVYVVCFSPKSKFKNFVPDGISANINRLNEEHKKSGKYPHIITWGINNEKTLEKAKKCSEEYTINTKNFKESLNLD